MTKFTARTLTSCVPICRSELFEEITQSDSSHLVSSVWIVPGHVFVSLANGSKLITFDCKPVIYHHNIGTSTLDFPALKPAVLDIFISPSSASTVYIVQQNGHVYCCQFSSAFQWSSITEFDLCESANSEILSICLHPKHNTYYWCEKQHGGGSVYRICSRPLPDGGQEMGKKKEQTSTSVILKDCPVADVLALGHGLLVVPRYKTDLTRVCIFWRPSVLELVSVTTVIGSTVRDHYDMRSPLIFSEVLLSCLTDLTQVPTCPDDLGVKKDLITGNAALLYSDGTVQTFHGTEDDEKQPIAAASVKISMPEQLLQTDSPSDAWNIHKNIIAIATIANTVRLYSASEGYLIHELEMEGGVFIRSLVCVRTPAVLVAMLTSSGVTVAQGGKTSGKPTAPQTLPNDKHFQTDALQVALLTQQREKKPGQHISDQLSALHSKWEDLQAHQPRSQLSETVDTYLTEFWRLEDQANHLGVSQSSPLASVYNTREMVHEAVMRSRAVAPEAAIAELMWLSQKYPADLLHVLLGDLDLEKEELTAEDQILWQSTLGLESADGQLNIHYSTITFELVCRLLYQERPHALVSFVRNAQAVSEQAVGVSAFVRRKHMLQYYMRAMECLPEPNLSKHPEKAASAKAEIILLGASDQGPELALRFLLHHSQWSEAIRLLERLGTDAPQHISLFFLLLQHLLEGQALSDYATQVFSLLSSWKSFLPALKVMSDSSGAQSATPSPSLFYSGSPDIPLSALRPHLMALLSAHKK